MVASLTPLPVLGVPVQSAALNGLDSLLSIVQMPGGVPVATLAIGKAGARNAGLLAAAILALSDDALGQRLEAFRAAQSDSVPETP
jgi:5-(carboxyamino)imidazole ribonucleotide mutase